MLNMPAWDWVLLVIGAFVAVSALARLMRRHRDQVLQQLTEEAAAEQQRQRLARQLEKQRKAKAAKRGFGQKVELRGPEPGYFVHVEDWLALDEALTRLTEQDARIGRVVEMRFFSGLSEDEIADVLNVNVRTIKRDWSFARLWLQRELTR